MMNSTDLSKKSGVNPCVQKNEVSVSYMTPIVFPIVKSDKHLVVDVGKKNKIASKSKDVLGICLYTQNDCEKLFRITTFF